MSRIMSHKAERGHCCPAPECKHEFYWFYSPGHNLSPLRPASYWTQMARCSNRQELFTNTSLVPVRTLHDPKPVNIRSGVYSPHPHHQTPYSRPEDVTAGPKQKPLTRPLSCAVRFPLLSRHRCYSWNGTFRDRPVSACGECYVLLLAYRIHSNGPTDEKAPPVDPGAPWGLGVVAVITNLDLWHCNINTFDWPISTPYVHYYTGFINNKHEHSRIIHLGMYLVIFSE